MNEVKLFILWIDIDRCVRSDADADADADAEALTTGEVKASICIDESDMWLTEVGWGWDCYYRFLIDFLGA